MRLGFELQALRAELSTLLRLLDEANEVGDVAGQFQLSQRISEIEELMAQVEPSVRDRAAVSLYFDGKPVLGSRGIETEFAGKTLERFQDMVSKHFASKELGTLKERGTVPLKDCATLMLTGVTRGSFGFTLEEILDQGDLFESSLKQTVSEMIDIIGHSASASEEDFENAVVDLDHRTLLALREFFGLIDANGATVKLTEGNKWVALDANGIRRARQRTEATDIEESVSIVNGRLIGFLPEHKRFEMKANVEDKEVVIHGSSSKEAALAFQSLIDSGRSVIGEEFAVTMLTRVVKPRNRAPRTIYQIQDFDGSSLEGAT